MVGATPKGMGHHILKMTLNSRINSYVLVHFYITTLTLLYFLRLQGGGGAIAPYIHHW